MRQRSHARGRPGLGVDAVIVAGGSSERFGGTNKLLVPLGGISILARSTRAIAAANTIERIVLVGAEASLPDLEHAARQGIELAGRRLQLVTVCGGRRRRDSVEAGLAAASTALVAIHDAARPLVDAGLVERVIAAADLDRGAIVAVRVTDTIKEVRDGVITGHPDRATLWAAQTPQVVPREGWLRGAALDDSDATDDAEMLSRAGIACTIVEGDGQNIKITHPADLAVAEAMLEREAGR
ncbi:MAG: 2-C-methyl-D-erythritol 4-phosphate cytidylyltransferase [Dehalococcoidia bacterium]|nr:2-C-methyl-D-erythritol 4-phosphate cytidylyltransferase [Dehalococcoidia bacterium]